MPSRERRGNAYRREAGGAHLDLGLLGARIFVPAVRSALDAGCGRLWEIQKVASSADAAPVR